MCGGWGVCVCVSESKTNKNIYIINSFWCAPELTQNEERSKMFVICADIFTANFRNKLGKIFMNLIAQIRPGLPHLQ